jgi:flagella basal body P-ring formation protein FlgA
MRAALLMLALVAAPPVLAGTVVPAHVIRAQTVIEAGDLALIPDRIAGAVQDPAALIGLEARVMLYPGRPVTLDLVGPPALVERNQTVPLIFTSGGLMIETEARALDRGGVGDLVRVMNMTSKKTVSGRVRPDGSVEVGQD